MKILLVSPFFAPVSSVGAVRMTSLANYLTNNHQVSVFTLSEEAIKRKYSDILQSKPIENVSYFYFFMEEIYHYPSLREKKTIQNCLDQVMNKESFDIVLVSSGPIYTQGIVRKVCKKHSVPYVLDMRDLDLLDYYFHEKSKKYFLKWKHKIAQCLKKQIEKDACRCACKITVANPNHSAILSEAYRVPSTKIMTILNGFDDVLFQNCVKKSSPEDFFTIGCFGKLLEYDKERTLCLFQIVDELNQKYGNISIKHVGEGQKAIEKMIEDNQLNPTIYQGRGFMDYKDGITEMSGCNMYAMVWVHPNSLSTKIFDYLALNKPVVSISPKNTALGNLVGDLQNVLFTDEDIEASNFIEKVMLERLSQADSNLDTMQYARVNSNRQFEKLLCEQSISRN